MNKKLQVAKLIVGVISVAVTCLTTYLNDKEFDEKVSEKVSEVLAKGNEEA